jgi:hypothetical protein
MKKFKAAIIYIVVLGGIAAISAFSIKAYPDCHTDTECEALDGAYGEGY